MSDDQRAAVQQVFDGAADTYDAVGVSMFQPIAEQLVTDLSPRSGERALDVGCGRGAVLFRLAEAVGPTGRAIGIDLSPRMVEATAAEAAAAGLPAEVAVGDAEAPDVPDAAFELVTSSLVLFFLPDPAAAPDAATRQAWQAALDYMGLEPGRPIAARRVGPHGTVYAIEASPSVHALLRENLALNETDNVVPLHAAVAGAGPVRARLRRRGRAHPRRPPPSPSSRTPGIAPNGS